MKIIRKGSYSTNTSAIYEKEAVQTTDKMLYYSVKTLAKVTYSSS